METVEILLVEDNEGDVILTREAFRSAKITSRLNVVRDGEQALDFLHKRSGFEESVDPDLILLDLNLPKKDGRQVLEEIKGHDALRRIPVVVMSGSSAERDVNTMYDLHANCYIVKPLDIGDFVSVVRSVEDFWFSVAKLPHPAVN